MKKRIAVIFGGRSSEHEVSIVSARSVMNALDRSRYDVVPVAIAKNGRWLSLASSAELLSSGEARKAQEILVPEPGSFDVAFPLVHGTYGEDGCLQGFLEMAGVPYVGCGVLGSAIGMDKGIQKRILRANEIPVVNYVEVRSSDWAKNADAVQKTILKTLTFPMFAKPANNGSSIGISKVKNEEQLRVGISEALRYDTKILVEQGVEHAREIECAVLGNDEPRASVLGEIKPSNEFYDYNAKYVDGASESIIPVELSSGLMQAMREMAVRTFLALDGSGMARVDFLLNGETNEWVVSEVNTIPGFTSISMYPKLWQASGLPYPQLLDELIALAEERFAKKASLETSYQPSKEWHRLNPQASS